MRLTRSLLLLLIISFILLLLNGLVGYLAYDHQKQQKANQEARIYQLRGLRDTLLSKTKSAESYESVLSGFETLPAKISAPQPTLRDPAARIALLRKTLKTLVAQYYLQDMAITLSMQKRFSTQHEDMFMFVEVDLQAKAATDGLIVGFTRALYDTLPGDVRITQLAITHNTQSIQPIPLTLKMVWHVPKWRKEIY